MHLVCLPVVIQTCLVIQLLVPRSKSIMGLFIIIYEAYCFLIFRSLIVAYCGGNVTSMEIIRRVPPRKIWATPPLCCIWIFCYHRMKPTTLTQRGFFLLNAGVKQFIFLGASIAIVETTDEMLDVETTHFQIIFMLSTLVCMYSLIVLLGIF
eukprot:UN02997